MLPDTDGSYPALIFKASPDTIHHGEVAIARTLGRMGVPVYAIVRDRYTPLALSRYVKRAIVWRPWPADRESFLDAMAALGQSIGHRTILIPIDDLSAIHVSEHASSLARWYCVPESPPNVSRQLANKASLYALCKEIGLPSVRTAIARTIDDVHEFMAHTTFPIVVKAADQWQLLQDKYNVAIMRNEEEFLQFYQQSSVEQRSRMLLQEYIPGEDWIYHGYSNANADLYVGFTGKKLMSYPPSGGATAIGVSINNQALSEQCEKLLRAVSYSGVTDMDWRYDQRDGQYKLLDCNPRVGMNFRMFENSAGIDVIRAQYLDLTGKAIHRPPMIQGRRFVVEPYYLLGSLRGGRPAPVPEEVHRNGTGNTELAWWSGDDSLPSLAMSPRLLSRTAMRVVSRLLK